MEDTIPFNLNFKYDDRLRERPEFPEEFRNAVKYLEEKIKSPESELKKGQLLSYAGVLCRISGELEKSLLYLERAREIFNKEEHEISGYINRIRIAQTYQLMNRHDEAESLLKCLLEESSEDEYGHLEDFIRQHLGKVYFDKGLYVDAESEFKKALKIRLLKDNEELIESTEFALRKILKIKSNE